jgi:hypothetical protein
MTDANDDLSKLLLDFQERIDRKLKDLSFTDGEAAGDIIHHLAEVAVIGNKIFASTVPGFLALPADRASDLADVVVDLQHDLWEIKEAILEMDPHLLKLVNFLNP